MIENHPVLHYALALLFYHLGLVANFFVAAHLGMASKNNDVSSLKQYLSLRWMPLVVRWIMCLGSFLLIWENPALGVEKFLDDSLTLHLGAAIFVGFGIDEATSKALALIGLQKELPAVPVANEPPPNP